MWSVRTHPPRCMVTSSCHIQTHRLIQPYHVYHTRSVCYSKRHTLSLALIPMTITSCARLHFSACTSARQLLIDFQSPSWHNTTTSLVTLVEDFQHVEFLTVTRWSDVQDTAVELGWQVACTPIGMQSLHTTCPKQGTADNIRYRTSSLLQRHLRLVFLSSANAEPTLTQQERSQIYLMIAAATWDDASSFCLLVHVATFWITGKRLWQLVDLKWR